MPRVLPKPNKRRQPIQVIAKCHSYRHAGHGAVKGENAGQTGREA